MNNKTQTIAEFIKDLTPGTIVSDNQDEEYKVQETFHGGFKWLQHHGPKSIGVQRCRDISSEGFTVISEPTFVKFGRIMYMYNCELRITNTNMTLREFNKLKIGLFVRFVTEIREFPCIEIEEIIE